MKPLLYGVLIFLACLSASAQTATCKRVAGVVPASVCAETYYTGWWRCFPNELCKLTGGNPPNNATYYDLSVAGYHQCIWYAKRNIGDCGFNFVDAPLIRGDQAMKAGVSLYIHGKK